MTLAGRKVLLLAASDFEDMELLYPLYRLREEDVAVTVAGLDDQPVTGKKGHGPVAVDTTVDGLSARDFDALVIPGGYAPDKLRRSAAVLDLVRAFDDTGKPIAFICHAGWDCGSRWRARPAPLPMRTFPVSRRWSGPTAR